MMTQLPPDQLAQAELEECDARDVATDALTEILAEEERADGKARDLLGLFGVLTGTVITVAITVHLPTGATIALWVTALPLLAALGKLLLIIRPDFAEALFTQYAQLTPQALATRFRAESDAVLANRAQRVQGHAASVVRKYTGIRAAVNLVLIGGLGVIAALILAVIA
jgi:hypothetical protein